MPIISQALRLTLVMMIFTGLAFPVLITVVGKLLFPFQAAGSLYVDSNNVVRGSVIIGQNFTSTKYFQGRPSSAGSGYDAANTSGSNLGPTSAKLIEGIVDDASTPDSDEFFSGIKQFASAYRELNAVADTTKLPADAVTRSASGIDPDISPANAYLQAARVAKERNVDVVKVTALIQKSIEARFFGVIGEPRVNVLLLNLALDKDFNT